MKNLLTTISAVAVIAFASPAFADTATCSTDLSTLDGSNFPVVSGKVSCPKGSFQAEPEIDADETLALSAALSTPAWLGDSERFSISGGLGFSESATAIGATGLVRIDKTFSAFAGGAVNTDGDGWAGKAGIRAGW